jgi:hypothetical protein
MGRVDPWRVSDGIHGDFKLIGALADAGCGLAVSDAFLHTGVLNLQRRRLLYWGDVDTHGFAMLDRFRGVFPATASLMMDRATLLAHRRMWVEEPDQCLEQLPRLDASEGALYRELLSGSHCEHVRLEQERIAFGWVKAALAR